MHLAPSVFVQVTFLSFKYLISFSGICIIYLPRSDSIAPSLRVRRQSRAGANDNKHRYQHRIQKAGATSAKTQEPWRYQQPSAENQVYPFFPHPERGEGCDGEHGYRKTDNVIVQYCGTAGIMTDDPGRHEHPYSQKQVHPVWPSLFFHRAPYHGRASRLGNPWRMHHNFWRPSSLPSAKIKIVLFVFPTIIIK